MHASRRSRARAMENRARRLRDFDRYPALAIGMLLTDPEIDRFLASMSSVSCKRFVQRSIMDFKSITVAIFILFPSLFAIPIGVRASYILDLSTAGSVLIAITWLCGWSFVFALLFVRYQKWRLRRYVRSVLVADIFPNCPQCNQSQAENALDTCCCGCIVRPFAG